MILNEQVANKLKSLLSSMPSWKNLTNSQFVQHLAVFVGWAVEDANFKVERARQEAFIGTALNRSSLIAHAEDREYLPRKPKPSEGTVLFINSGLNPILLKKGCEFTSEAQLPYTLGAKLLIPAQSKVTAPIKQYGKTSIFHIVTEEKPFYEILIGKELTPKVMSLEVWVDSGDGFERWGYSRLLTNAYRDSHVWDEFYHVSDQIGIRFGNGTFGKIPPQGTSVRIDIEYTSGDTLLLERQYLYPLEEIIDTVGVPASLQIEVAETIQNGQSQEPTEEMRRNLHYWPVYNERLIWDNDYTYFLRRRFPEIVFVRAWGEEEAERLWGIKIEHINKIWICAYAPRDGLTDDVMNALAEVPMMCRNFQWYAPEHVFFTLKLTARILSDKVLSEVEEDVRAALLRAYGRDSLYRRDRVLISEIYECIQSTGHFEKETGAWFEAIPEGNFEANLIYQMVSLDLENSEIQIAHLT